MTDDTTPSPTTENRDMPERLRAALNGAALSHYGKPTGFAAISISLLRDAADRLEQAERARDEAIAAEREACARIADDFDGGEEDGAYYASGRIAEIIRERASLPTPKQGGGNG